MQQVKVIDKSSGETLFECPLEKRDQAYSFAAQMEQMDLEVDIIAPSLNESLGRSLGLNDSEIEKLKQVMEEEIDSHNDCCSPSTQA